MKTNDLEVMIVLEIYTDIKRELWLSKRILFWYCFGGRKS